MRFDRLMRALMEESVDEFVMSVGCKPKVKRSDPEDLVELETIHLDESHLLEFLNWAVPNEHLVCLPLDEQFRFAFEGTEFTISASETEVVIRKF